MRLACSLAMVAIGAFNALARFAGKWLGVNLASNTYLELQWYLFSLLFLLASAYTLQRDQHVRGCPLTAVFIHDKRLGST